jgi:acetyl-CoA acetyltransferase
MAVLREPVLAGIGALAVTRDPVMPLPDLAARVCREALDDAGLPASAIDGLFVTPSALSGEPWMMWAAGLAEYLGLETRSLMMAENGGTSALAALRCAMDAVALGRVDHALVLATDTRPTLDMAHFESFVRDVTFRSMSLYGPVYGLMGLGTPIPIYAMSHQRYMHEHGVSEEAIAGVSVQLRGHAADHPLAQFRKPITVDDVVTSETLCPPIRLLQAASISAGACAVVVSADGDGVRITGWGEHHDPSHFIPRRGSITTFPSVRAAAAQAFDQAHRSVAEVDVAEVYGVFGATELILYEDLGFCPTGEGAQFVADGGGTWGHDVVINPSGGRLSFGHPAGATPLYEVAEVARQLRGDAPGRAVDGARVGLVHAEHGMMNGSVVLILEC